MKLSYDRKSKDPTYFIQQGFRNGKKTTQLNIGYFFLQLALNAVFVLGLDKKYYLPKELNKKIKKILG